MILGDLFFRVGIAVNGYNAAAIYLAVVVV